MRYFIYACPSRYRNDENMHDFEIVENFSYEEARDRAISLGYETIENYMRPEEEIYTREDYVADIVADEWDDDYEEDYYASLDDAILDEIDYEVYEIKEETSSDIIRDLEMNRLSFKDFIKDYCYSATETIARNAF